MGVTEVVGAPIEVTIPVKLAIEEVTARLYSRNCLKKAVAFIKYVLRH